MEHQRNINATLSAVALLIDVIGKNNFMFKNIGFD